MNFIVYVSQAVKPFSNEELSALLEYSRTRNTKEEVTGLLIYRYNSDVDRGNFVQILEGPKAAVDDVWNRVANDSRHHTVIVVEEGEMDKRMFGDWSMGFKNVDAEDLAGFEGFSDLGSDAFWEKLNAGAIPEALDLLKSFYDGT